MALRVVLWVQGQYQGAVERACVRDAFVKHRGGYAGKPDQPRKRHREKRERQGVVLRAQV